MGDVPKVKKILEESLSYFNKNETEYTFLMAHILIYLAMQLTPPYAIFRRTVELNLYG